MDEMQVQQALDEVVEHDDFLPFLRDWMHSFVNQTQENEIFVWHEDTRSTVSGTGVFVPRELTESQKRTLRNMR